MQKFIMNILDLKESDLEDFLSIESTNHSDFLIALKVKDHYCPSCGVLTTTIKDYKTRKLTHKILLNSSTTLYYRQRRYLCKLCNHSFIENNPFGNHRSKLTPRVIFQIITDLKPYHSTFSNIATKYNISVTTVVSLFDSYVQIPRKKLSSVLCLDEFYFNRHSRYKYSFMIMNFLTKEIIDIVESRHYSVLSDYFYSIPKPERLSVKYVCVDMYPTYHNIIHTFLPNATICIDSFHVIKALNDAINSIRKKTMNSFKEDKSSRNYRLLKYRHKLLLKSPDDINYLNFYYDSILSHYSTEERTLNILLDISSKLKTAYSLKKRYVRFNDIPSHLFNLDTHSSSLDDIIHSFLTSEIPELIHFGSMIKKWKTEILNSFTWFHNRRISNGPIEGKNTYIKKIISNANGLNNFQRSRNKFLYSQNLYQSFSLIPHNNPLKRSGHLRGPYKKRK